MWIMKVLCLYVCVCAFPNTGIDVIDENDGSNWK